MNCEECNFYTEEYSQDAKDNIPYCKKYRESYNDDLISYTESVDMLLSDMRLWGFKDLTKDKLNEILQGNSFSISRAVKMELNRILNKEE